MALTIFFIFAGYFFYDFNMNSQTRNARAFLPLSAVGGVSVFLFMNGMPVYHAFLHFIGLFVNFAGVITIR